VAEVTAQHHIDLTDLERIPVRVARSQLTSTIVLVSDVLGMRCAGTPEPWRRAIRSALDRRDVAVLAPVSDARSSLVPDCVLPVPYGGTSKLEDDLASIASTEPERLAAELAADIGPRRSPQWRIVEQHPQRWLQAYSGSLGRAAQAVAPVWSAAAGLLEREIERVGAAAMCGTLRELLSSFHPLGRIRGDRLSLPRRGRRDGHWTLSPHGLVLTPMLAGPGTVLVRRTGSLVTHIGYPLPGLIRLLDDERTDDASLEALLGSSRARVLRALDEPARVGALARVLQAVPSAATYHISALEDAGLVHRRREGQRVVVRRTRRGTAVLSLYDC
jgi:DNA-binding transcriptional ArsR family regulator